MKKENRKRWRLCILILGLLLCVVIGIKFDSPFLWLASSAGLCLAMLPHLIIDTDQKEEYPEGDPLREYVARQFRKDSYEVFAVFAVFKLITDQHELFEQIVRSNNAEELEAFFAHEYNEFISNPEIVGIMPDLINRNKNDTSSDNWNTDIFKLRNGDYAALLFMPIQYSSLSARMVGVVLSTKGDAHYYCMVNKDEQTVSAVIRRRKDRADRIGEVKGIGSELMQKFLDCMKKDFYRPDNWEIYRRQHVISAFDDRYIGIRHQEMIHILRLGSAFPLDKLAEESTSLDGFISGISNEMYKAAVRISEELSANSDKKVFTLFYFNYEPDSNRDPEITPEEIAWFYMLLNREKVAHFLEPYQLNKLDGLLSADHVELHRGTETSEWCRWRLLKLRSIFADSDCSVFNWDYVIGRGGRESKFAWLYAYHMGCSEEIAVNETRTVLNKMIDPKLKTLYPGWEMAIGRGVVYMIRDYKALSLEDWLNLEHPFFEAHSKNSEDSAKWYYELFYSESWPDRNITISGYVESILYDSEQFSGEENAHILSAQFSDEYPDFYGVNYGHYRQVVKLEFISENAGDVSVNVDDCEIPCEGWYEKEDRRFLVNPLEMTGLFEFCDVIEDWTPEGDDTISGIGKV